MRILVITPYYFPHPGGSQAYIRDLYNQLIEDYGVEVDVLTYDTEGVGKRDVDGKINIYRVSSMEVLRGQFALPNYIELFSLIRKLKENNYDLVNSHTRFFDNSWWTPMVAKYLGVKSILTDHCASHPKHSNILVRGVSKMVDKSFGQFVGKKYDGVTVASRATGEFLKKLGIPSYKVIHGGVKLGDFKSGNKSKDELVVTFVGRMIKAKNPDLLVEVARKLESKRENVKFLFAGNGPMLKRLKKLAPKNCEFLGSIPKKEVAKILSKTDVFAYPTEHHEGFPIALLEAGASGCAVVASNEGGIGELIDDGVSGLLIDPEAGGLYKSIERLLTDAKLRKKLGIKLRLKVKNEFTWKNIGKGYYEYVKTLVDL